MLRPSYGRGVGVVAVVPVMTVVGARELGLSPEGRGRLLAVVLRDLLCDSVVRVSLVKSMGEFITLKHYK